MTDSIVGRAAEQQRLEAALRSARNGRSQVLVVRGAAGTGKSALLQESVTNADGMLVLSARGFESETEIAFAGLSDLLRSLHNDLGAIPPPQAAALAGALAVGPPVDADRFTVCAAVLSLLASAAEKAPLLVTIDDAQWLDTSSVRAVLFAARRLNAEAVAVIVASRMPEDQQLDFAGLPQMLLGGLDRAAARALLARINAPANMADTIFDATGGNPLGLLELPALLPAQTSAPVMPLPSGTTLEAALRRRIDQLPEPTRGALLVAAASESAPPAVVVAATERLGLDVADFGPAERDRIVTITSNSISFQHPLLRSVLYHASPAGARRDTHLALAAAFADTGERGTDQHAWHLAAGTLAPDDEVAQTVAEAGMRARRRGAYASATLAFERAARLTPGHNTRATRLLEAAKCAHLAGNITQVAGLLSDALRDTDDLDLRSRIHHRLGYVEMWRQAPPAARKLLMDEAAGAAPAEPLRAALMRTDAAIPSLMMGELSAALDAAELAAAGCAEAGIDRPPMTDVIRAAASATLGRRADARRHLRGLANWLERAHPLRAAQELLFAGLSWIWLEDYTQARALIQRPLVAARQASALGVLPYALGIASELDYRVGRWSVAYASTTESVQLAEETGQRNAYGRFYLARIEAAQGREEDCLRHLQETAALADRFDIGCLHTYVGSAYGLLALGLGRPEEAIDRLEPVGELAAQQGLGEATVVGWEPDLIEAYVRCGRPGQAQTALTAFAPPAEATDQIWAQAAAHRCRGLLAGPDDFEAHFVNALAWHNRTTTPFECARTQLCYGERLRRHRQRAQAREWLGLARATFQQLGAGPWINRARAELAAAGETSAGSEAATSLSLTPQELQVALVVAGGATNQEAAAAMFLSPKTVEYHLTRIYRKTGLSSRQELGGLLASQD